MRDKEKKPPSNFEVPNHLSLLQSSKLLQALLFLLFPLSVLLVKKPNVFVCGSCFSGYEVGGVMIPPSRVGVWLSTESDSLLNPHNHPNLPIEIHLRVHNLSLVLLKKNCIKI